MNASLLTVNRRAQRGISLIEVIASLALVAVVIGGALALLSSGNTSAYTTQMQRDLVSIRAALQQIYNGQGGYTAGSLNSILINANRVPTTMSISGTTITHALNGTVTVTGATSNFTITVTNIPSDVCVGLVSGAAGYQSVQVGANPAITSFPVSPATSSSQCAGGPKTIVFTAA